MKATRITATLVLAAAALWGAVGCGRPAPGSAKNTDELLTQLQDDRSQIDQASDLMMKRIDMFNSTRKEGEKTLQFSEIFAQDLNPDQRDILDTLVQQEKDVSYKALLTKIISDRDTIRGLQEKVMHLEQTLPDKFVVAKRGDRQQDLAMNYLTGEAHLDAEKAKTLLKQSDQTDELVAGNQVWFFYDPNQDTFRTYVTQGTAGQTPIMVRRAQKKALIKERDVAKAERDTAQSERDNAQAQAAQLDEQKTQLENEMATKANSVYYHAASSQALKDQGVLSGVLKRLQDVKNVSYDQSLDLRAGSTITLTPQAYGLETIKGVRLLPGIYQEGRDYSVETAEDYTSARLVILDPEVFKGKEILLALGG